MTVAKRMFLLVTVALLGFVALACLSQYQIHRVYDTANYSNVNSVPSIVVLDDAYDHFEQLNKLTWLHMATHG